MELHGYLAKSARRALGHDLLMIVRQGDGMQVHAHYAQQRVQITARHLAQGMSDTASP